MKAMMPSIVYRVVVAASTCLLLLIGISAADDSLAKPTDAEARKHISKGNKLYNLGEFAQAVEEYKAGALAQDAPVFHFNLGQCYRQMGAYKEAVWQYERFLARGKPTGQLKAAVEGFLVQMKSELETKAMSQPPRDLAPPREATPPREARPETKQTRPAQTIAPIELVEPGPPWYKDTWGWGFTAGGVIAGSVSAFLVWSAVDLDNDANTEPDVIRQNELHDRADARRIWGVLTGVGGAALITTGVVKLAVTGASRRTNTAWNFGIHRQGVAFMARF